MLPLETLVVQASSQTDSAPSGQHSVDWLPAVEPDCLGNLMQVGYLAVGRSCFAEARAIFQGLIALRPTSEIPLLGLTVTELSAGNLQQATQLLEMAARIQPDAPHTVAIAEVLQHCLANHVGESLPDSPSPMPLYLRR